MTFNVNLDLLNFGCVYLKKRIKIFARAKS